MKKTKRLEVRRLTLTALAQPQGGYVRPMDRSYADGCSNSCNSCGTCGTCATIGVDCYQSGDCYC